MNLKRSARSVRGPSNWAHLVSHTKSEKHQLASKSLQRSHAIARTTLSPAPGSRCNWRCFGFGTHWFHLAQINIHVWRQKYFYDGCFYSCCQIWTATSVDNPVYDHHRWLRKTQSLLLKGKYQTHESVSSVPEVIPELNFISQPTTGVTGDLS